LKKNFKIYIKIDINVNFNVNLKTTLKFDININFNVNFKVVFQDNSIVHQLVNKKTFIVSRCAVCMWTLTRVSISVGIQQILSGSHYFCEGHQPRDTIMQVRRKDFILSHRYDSVSIVHIIPSKYKPPHMNFYS
jgi:hypothetical protein